METRERKREEAAGQGGGGSTGPGPQGNLESLRQAAETFLAAGDAAISKALSGNSEKFLAANRQQGGE
jgi:hypothetical protein